MYVSATHLICGGILFSALFTACTSQPVLTPTATPPPSTATLTATATATLTATVTATITPLPLPTQTPSPTPTLVIAICSPLRNHPLSQLPSLISWAFDPNPQTRHYGVDFSHWRLGDEESSLHDPVQSALNGRVAGFVNNRPPYGNMIMIETPYSSLPPGLIEQVQIPEGQSVYHLYAHLADSPALAVGQPIPCGELLNRVGLTGWAVTAHLHFETRWGPPKFIFTEMAYYTADATVAEMEKFETWFLSGQYQAFDPMILLSLPQP